MEWFGFWMFASFYIACEAWLYNKGHSDADLIVWRRESGSSSKWLTCFAFLLLGIFLGWAATHLLYALRS